MKAYAIEIQSERKFEPFNGEKKVGDGIQFNLTSKEQKRRPT